MPIVSTRWSVKDAITVARTMIKAITQKEILFNDVNLAYKIALLDVASELANAKDPAYNHIQSVVISTTTPTIGDSFFVITSSSLAYPVELVIAVHDAAYGQCVQKGLDEFISLIATNSIDHASYKDSIIWTMVGNTIYFKHGSGITLSTTKKIFYQRSQSFPTSFESTTEYVDIPDKYIPLFVKRMVTYLIGSAASPAGLSQELQGDAAKLVGAITADLQNRNKFASQTTDRES